MIGYRIGERKHLSGSVDISVSKNAGLPILAATILMKDETRLYNMPALSDIKMMCDIISSLRGNVIARGKSLSISTNNLKNIQPPMEMMKSMRASFLLMGPMLARFQKANIPLPGGCKIGARPVDLHIKGLNALGAKIEVVSGVAYASGQLVGGIIKLDFPSVGATENIVMAATLAKGESIIMNAAKEPEIVDLCDFLRKAGAKISGDGTNKIKIKGVAVLLGVDYQPISDRIEAGTFMIAAAATKGDVRINGINPKHNQAVIQKLIEGGVEVHCGEDYVEIKPSDFKGVNVYTQPYPGFPTDLQAPMMVLCCLANGQSSIVESMFENRYNHVNQLIDIGADIRLVEERAIINKSEFSGGNLSATDLRAGAAMVIAGMCSNGPTIVEDVGHIKRGYDDFALKLNSLGADVSIIPMGENNTIKH